jgi:hypothetical protein
VYTGNVRIVRYIEMRIPGPGAIAACAAKFGKGTCRFRLSLAVFIILTFVLIIPLIVGSLSDITPASVFLMISSTLIFQAAAVLVGLGLSLDPFTIIVMVTSVAIGVMVAILEICDLFSESSPRVAAWLARIGKKTEKYTFLHTYGVIMLIPVIWIPGIALYGSPIIAWLFQWKEIAAITCMVIGWLLACIFVLALGTGIIGLIL